LTNLHKIWHKRVVLHAIYTEASDFRKVQKPGHKGQKTSKFRSNFHPGRHVFARSDETVKVFWKIFSAMTSRLLYLSENVIVTVQNRPVFSNTWLNGASKNTDFEVKYLANGIWYGQSLYGVSIGNICVPIGNIAWIWPRVILNRDTGGRLSNAKMRVIIVNYNGQSVAEQKHDFRWNLQWSCLWWIWHRKWKTYKPYYAVETVDGTWNRNVMSVCLDVNSVGRFLVLDLRSWMGVMRAN
jgi:hypothetical protein